MNRVTKGTALVGNLNASGTVTADDISTMSVTFTIGTEATNAINVAMQFNDGNGVAQAVKKGVMIYLSDDANGNSVAGTAPDSGIAIGTDGLLMELVADKAGLLITEDDGDADITISESGIDTWYLAVVLPNGSVSVSDAITFA